MLPFFEIPVSPYPEEEEWETEVHRQEEAEAVEEEVIGDPPDSTEKGTFHGRGKNGGRTKQAGFHGDSSE
ncbi:hypothetical protein RCO48_26195 [Peribacillus frigoritolerans]|nr:hypothetical protein [Peribacillus frigoritolerans]